MWNKRKKAQFCDSFIDVLLLLIGSVCCVVLLFSFLCEFTTCNLFQGYCTFSDAKDERCRSKQIHLMLSGWVICATKDNVGSNNVFYSTYGICFVYKLPTLSVLSLIKYLFETPFLFDFF